MPPGRSFILVGYDPTPPDYRPGTIGRDRGAILDKLGGKVSVMGISYGGLAALRKRRRSSRARRQARAARERT
jgi:pimeloyl-ACP methyl ester carboxylesterase